MNTRTVEGASLSLLVAVDGSAHSDAAVRWVASLNAAGGAVRCVLLHVQKPLMAGEVGVILQANVVMAERARRAGDIIDAAAAVLRACGVEFTVAQKTGGDAAAAIIESQRDPACHAIIVGRRGQGALRTALLGSISASVVRQATVPVILINAGMSPIAAKPLSVLVACDDAPPSRHAAAAAAQFACHAGRGSVHLVHVRPDLTVAGAIFGPREQLVRHWSGAEWTQAFAEARTVVETAGCTCTVHPVFGDQPGAQILQTAKTLGCGMIAMGTRGLGPVSQALLGSTAQHVVERADVPVLLSR